MVGGRALAGPLPPHAPTHPCRLMPLTNRSMPLVNRLASQPAASQPATIQQPASSHPASQQPASQPDSQHEEGVDRRRSLPFRNFWVLANIAVRFLLLQFEKRRVFYKGLGQSMTSIRHILDVLYYKQAWKSCTGAYQHQVLRNGQNNIWFARSFWETL